MVEREREIRAFVPEEYWEVHADLGTAKGANVRFEVTREKGEAFKPFNEAQAMAALEKLKASAYSVAKREDRPTSSRPRRRSSLPPCSRRRATAWASG